MSEAMTVPAAYDWQSLIDADTLARLLGRYGFADARVDLIGSSENLTFLVEPSAHPRTILRIYRNGHRDRGAIESELMWMQAITDDTDIGAPRVLPDLAGAHTQEVRTALGPTHGVMFERLHGVEPPEDDLHVWFPRLGRLCAQLHTHALEWRRPAGFVRPRLDWHTIIGPRAVWGSWQLAPGLDPKALPLLERVSQQLASRMESYGTASDRFGLIHGDLRLQNLLVMEGRIQVIDFDDCCISWLLYDLATALSLIEDIPEAQQLLQGWVSGYLSNRSLTDEDLEIIPDLIMLRRLQVLAWFGSRRGSEVTQKWAPQYAPATVNAGQDYLAGSPQLSVR
jgi:Ser/Thr protein kinase RdoA (MazF antagonist)